MHCSWLSFLQKLLLDQCLHLTNSYWSFSCVPFQSGFSGVPFQSLCAISITVSHFNHCTNCFTLPSNCFSFLIVVGKPLERLFSHPAHLTVTSHTQMCSSSTFLFAVTWGISRLFSSAGLLMTSPFSSCYSFFKNCYSWAISSHLAPAKILNGVANKCWEIYPEDSSVLSRSSL